MAANTNSAGTVIRFVITFRYCTCMIILTQVKSVENLIKFGRVFFEFFERTNRQTDIHIDTLITILRTYTRSEVVSDLLYRINTLT